jgi:uncharacterized membrane protein YdcZ (DUF606 family)
MTTVYLLAISIGLLVTISPILNGRNSLVLGTFKTSFYHYFFAFVFGVVFMLLTFSQTSKAQLGQIPPHYFLGGLLGLSVILMMNHYAVRIKAMHIAILPFLGQMTMGFVLDYFLLGLLELKVIIGMIVVLVGLYIQSTEK